MPSASSQVQRRSGRGYTPQDIRSGLLYSMLSIAAFSIYFAIVNGSAYTSFLKNYLRANDTAFGLIMGAWSAGVIFQLFSSYIIERTGRAKSIFLFFCVLARLCWLGMCAIALSHAPATRQIVLVGLVIVSYASLMNIGATGWTTWIADLVPKSIAGKFFGNRYRLNMVVMVLAAVAVSYIFAHYTANGRLYAVIFGVATVFGVLDVLSFVTVREIPRSVDAQLPSFADILKTPWQNPLFRCFALYTMVTGISYAITTTFAWPFSFDLICSVHGLEKQYISLANLFLFILPTVTMAWVAPFWGQAIDRFGPKPTLAVSALSQIIIPCGWLFVRHELLWMIPVITVLGALAWPGIDQVNFYAQIKVFPGNRRTAYIAMFALVTGLAAVAGSILGGYLATSWQHALAMHPYVPSWVSHYHLATFWRHALALLPHVPTWVSHYQPVFLIALLIRLGAFLFIMPRLPLEGTCTHSTVARSIAGDLCASISPIPHIRRICKRPRSHGQEHQINS